MVVKGVTEIFSFSEDNTFVQSSEEGKQKNLPGKNESPRGSSVVGGRPARRNNLLPPRSGRGMKRMGHDAEWQELDLLCRLFGVPRCQSKVLFTLLYRLPMVIKTHVILIT